MWSERGISEMFDIEGDTDKWVWTGGKTKLYIGFTFALRLDAFWTAFEGFALHRRLHRSF